MTNNKHLRMFYMSLNKSIQMLMDYEDINDSLLVSLINSSARTLVAQTSRSESAKVSYEIVNLVMYIIPKLSTERREAMINISEQKGLIEAKSLLLHYDEINYWITQLNDFKKIAHSSLTSNINNNYLNASQKTGLIKLAESLNKRSVSVVTSSLVTILYYVLSEAKISIPINEVIDTYTKYFSLDSYTDTEKNNLFNSVVKGDMPNIVFDKEEYFPTTIKLMLILIEDDYDTLSYMRHADSAIDNMQLNVSSVLLEDHFKNAELPGTVTISSVANIIKQFSGAVVRNAELLVSRLTATGEKIVDTVNNIDSINRATKAEIAYSYRYYSPVNNTSISVSLMSKDTLIKQLPTLKNVTKLSKHREFDLCTSTAGFITSGDLAEVISLYKSRYWVEYVFFLRGMAGVLTDDEVYWALTHTTNSNIQQGAMLFMRTMVAYNIVSSKAITFGDMTVSMLEVSNVTNSDSPLREVLEANYPLSYSMYGVFAQV